MSSPGSCCVRDSIQQTKRVRYTKTNNLYFNISNIHLFKTKGLYNIITSQNFEDKTTEKKEIFKKLLNKCDCDNINNYYEQLIDEYYNYSDQLKEVIKYSILEEGISDILYKKMLYLYLKIDGYNIKELEEEEEQEEEEKKIYHIEEENKIDCLYDTIKDIDKQEYNKLVSIEYLNKLTELNKLEINKYQFKRLFKTINENNKLLFESFNNKHKEHILNNSFMNNY